MNYSPEYNTCSVFSWKSIEGGEYSIPPSFFQMYLLHDLQDCPPDIPFQVCFVQMILGVLQISPLRFID